MAYRIPRGHEVNRPPYQELSQGIRPEVSAVPQEAYADLPPDDRDWETRLLR